MALPAGITPITITGKIANNKNMPAVSGSVQFRMPYPLADGPDHVVLAPGVWTFPIGSDGGIDTASDPMPAATSPGVSPAGWSYEITIRAVLADGSTWYRRFYATIPASTSFEQVLAAALPAAATASGFVPLSAVGATVAPLVGGKVPLQYLPAGSGGGVESVAALNGTIDVDNTDPANPKVGIGTGIPQSAVSGLTTALDGLTSGVGSASSTASSALSMASAASAAAGNAQTAATEAQATADAAQSTASAAYVKPGGGIPEVDLAVPVQGLLALAGTAVQSIPPYADPAAVRFGGHSTNMGLFNNVSTINGEVWAARVFVEPGNPINGAMTLRAPNGDQSGAPAASVGLGGLNGFALYPIAGGAKLADTGSDDSMWLAEGVVDKPFSAGVAAQSTRVGYLVLVSVRGYAGAPYFSFFNMGSNNKTNAKMFSRYRGGGFTSWPATLDPVADLAGDTGGFVLPVALRA